MITEGLLRIGAQIVLSKVADNVLSELSSSGDTQSSNLNLLSSDDSGDLATSIFTNFLSETLDTGASDSFGSSGDIAANILMSTIENSDLMDTISTQITNPISNDFLDKMSEFAISPFNAVLNYFQSLENTVFNLFGSGDNSNSSEA